MSWDTALAVQALVAHSLANSGCFVKQKKGLRTKKKAKKQLEDNSTGTNEPIAGETSTSLAINVRMRSSEPSFKQAAFNMGKAFGDVAFGSKGSLIRSLQGNLNKEAAFTLSDSEPGPHVFSLTNFHGEVGCLMTWATRSLK